LSVSAAPLLTPLTSPLTVGRDLTLCGSGLHPLLSPTA
jgi:hypothetical protein